MAEPSIYWEEEFSGTNDSDSDTDRDESLVILSVAIANVVNYLWTCL